jgi:hypothetical protein
MNSAKFYYEAYKRFITIPKITSHKFLEINTTQTLSSDMWKQLFSDVTVQHVDSLQPCEFDVCYVNLDNYDNIIPLLRSLNLAKNERGVHHFVLSSKSKFWAHSRQLFEDQFFWTENRRFYSGSDIGILPYKLKSPDGTILSEYPDPEGLVLEYR